MKEYSSIVTPDDWQCANCSTAARFHACGIVRRRRKFVAMLRIKNEERWICEVLDSLQNLCDDIFVFDDHSTDRTREIVQRIGKVHYFLSPFEGLNESRDKNYLYDRIMEWCEPEWIICVDGDEVLESRAAEIIRAAVGASPKTQSWRLKIAFMWDSPDQVRTDRIYGDFWRPSMFRPFVPRPHVADDLALLREFRFMSTPFGRHTGSDQPNLHCSSVPQRLIHEARPLPVRLKHYGYMDRVDRVRKLDYYTSIDWKNESEDWYRHMTQGDAVSLSELPITMGAGRLTVAEAQSLVCRADERLVHAGPRVLEPWDEGKEWSITAWAMSQ